MDRISNLPLRIIKTILCLLPYDDVVRTSTLSKEWRYHWTNVTKIVVIEDTRTMNRRKLLSGVGQALLMHKGPIHEVTLSVVADDHWGFDTEIRRIIISHLLSKKAVKKLTIDFVSRCQLKRRRKGQTSWAPKKKKKENKTSSGFGNLTSLTSLYLINSMISIKTLLHLLSTCPLLKTVALRTHDFYHYDGVTYTNLVESLMLIESLTIWCNMIAVLAAPGPDGYYNRIIPQKLPNALVHLKYLCIEGLDFVYCYGKPVISLLIRNSPNLEKLKLNIKDDQHEDEMPASSLSLEYYADIWLEHLTELEITSLSSEKTELDIVKLILMGSPVLKKLRIFISEKYKDKELQISETLLESLHASSVVEFIVENEPF
ncbi:F-box/FBD/LRR-repeat protein-like protein [Tanacetum coccineum]